MRTLMIAMALASSAALGACANSTQMATTAQDFVQLQSRCEAEGGRFVMTGRMTGRPALDNACKNFTAQDGVSGPSSSFRDPA